MNVCIHCSCSRVIKFGFRKTKERGSIQRYQCKACGRYFVPDIGFKHRHKPEKEIVETLRLVLTQSLREVAEFKRLSKNTPLAWLRYYAKKIKRYLERRVPIRCDHLHMDELFLKMQDTFCYLWDSISKDTRFAFLFLAPSRTNKHALKLMQISPKPDDVTTDGAFAYGVAIRKWYGVPFFYKHYRRCASFEDKKNNNLVERLQNTLRRYLHFRRGFYNCETGNIVLDFIWIYYNYIRKHTTIGCTPAEKAGVIYYRDQKFEYDRLLYLIESSFFVFFRRLVGSREYWLLAHQP